MSDPDTDAGYMREMLQKDADGKLFVDYLRIAGDELDDPAAYPGYMVKLRDFIDRRLIEFADIPTVREKYEWLRDYHAETLRKLRRTSRA